MKKICYVDKNIVWTEKNLELITKLNIDPVVYNSNTVNFNEIEYLLYHSKLADEELMLMKNCKYIGVRAHNTDYINKKITESMRIPLVGLQTQHSVNSVAEHTFALIFALAKNLITSHNNVADNQWRQDLGLNLELSGKKIGIVGNGKIGNRVAEIAKLFGMDVLIAGKKGKLKEGELDIDEILSEVDILTLHISSKAENRNYINAERLKLMKKGSILINTARGSVMDYDALEKEIKASRFLGVGLDVFPEEPLKENSFAKYSNVILTPHTAFKTKETIENMNQELLVNLSKHMK